MPLLSATPATIEDTWLPSACDMCFGACGIRVHRVNGVVTKIEGDPEAPHSRGRLCPKGQAGLMGLYDPNRVTVPLKRTNPEKGIAIDPGWVETTWEEALDIIVERLKKVRAEDPRKLVLGSWDLTWRYQLCQPWASAYGTPNHQWIGYFCGNYLHSTMYLTNASFHSDFDMDYCNYCILLGNQMGFMAGLNPNISSQKMAEARMRGMKVVVVDPIGTNAASKASEWVPIRPGTDAALILAMVNLLLNEYGIYDAEFLRRQTNGPYLVGPDGHYVREPGSSMPLAWDEAQQRAIPYDATTRPALKGEFTVNGVSCHPAFHLLKEHLRKYTLEEASRITTVPAATIRRLAREFGEAASVGSTITLKGKTLPLRPAAVNIYRGAGAHKHGALTGLAVQTLNLVMGSMYVPGGHRGLNPVGPGGKWQPGTSRDGFILPPGAIGHGRNFHDFEVRAPESLDLHEIFPISTNVSPTVQLSILDPSQFKLPYTPEVMLHCRTNLMMNKVNLKTGEATLKNIPFIVSVTTFLDEVSDFADIVLPDTHYLERLELFPNHDRLNNTPASGYWYWGLRQPVVKPPGQARSWLDVMLELADRLDMRRDLNELMNMSCGLKGAHRLEGDHPYTWEDIYDRWARSMFGEEYGLDWFRQHGYLKVPRTVEDTYPGPALVQRFPIYFENMVRAGEEVRAITEELGLKWDCSDYQGLPDWKPCPHFEPSGDFDLFAANYKVPFHYHSWTTENPWLTELGERHPSAFKVLINEDTARRKGVREGDEIWMESEAGKVKGVAHLSQCIHPEVVGIAGVFGSWGRGKPVARGKGVHYNSLHPLDLGRIDPVSSAVDSCIRVKVYKA